MVLPRQKLNDKRRGPPSGIRPYPLTLFVKGHGAEAGNRPADGPRAPDTQGTQRRLREKKCKEHPQHQIRKGCHHELLHPSGTAQDTIRHQLHRNDKVEGGKDSQNLNSSLQGLGGGFIHEKRHQCPATEHIQQK